MEQSKNSRGASTQLLRDERGITTVEYVIILVMVALVAVCSWSIFGHQIRCALGMANDQIAAGIGSDSLLGPQSCAKGGPVGDPGEHRKVKAPGGG